MTTETKKLHDYDKKRIAQARKAKAEFMEFVTTKPGRKLDDVFRVIDYMVKRMGFNTVITEQMPSWLLGHIRCFARQEYLRGRREERADVTAAFASPDTPNALGPMCELIERGRHVGMAKIGKPVEEEPEDRDGV